MLFLSADANPFSFKRFIAYSKFPLQDSKADLQSFIVDPEISLSTLISFAEA